MKFEKRVESRRMSGAMKEFVAFSKSAKRKESLPMCLLLNVGSLKSFL